MIVAAFQCLCVWLTEHPDMLDEKVGHLSLDWIPNQIVKVKGFSRWPYAVWTVGWGKVLVFSCVHTCTCFLPGTDSADSSYFE